MSYIARRLASSLRSSQTTSATAWSRNTHHLHNGRRQAVRCFSQTSTRNSTVSQKELESAEVTPTSTSTSTPAQPEPSAQQLEEDLVNGYIRNRRTSSERMEEVEQLSSRFRSHLKGLFPELDFPPELAQRILTHGGHVTAAARGHNAGLSFIGRRVLSAYMQLFLASCKPSQDVDLEAIEHATLDTRFLGQHAGSEWGFGRVLVWEHAKALSQMNLSDPTEARRTGLWKASGTAVEALVGGIYHQWGATVAQRFFHTRLFPLLSHHGRLPKEFRGQAQAICKQMGGRNGKLLPSSTPS